MCGCRDDKLGNIGTKKITRIGQTILWDRFLPNKISFIDYLIMELPAKKMEDVQMKRKYLALQVKYLLRLKEEMLTQFLRPIKIASEFSNQMVAKASDEDVMSLLACADG